MMGSDFGHAPTSIAELIKFAQEGLALSDNHIAEAMGYDNPAVVELLKLGKMRVPINKVPQLAQILEVPPAKLMQMALGETSPVMLQAIEACYGPMVLSEGEARLINSIREAAGVREPALLMFEKQAVVAVVVASPVM